MTLNTESFPAIETALNVASLILLAAGYANIRKGRMRAHAACMISAFALSLVFLGLYVTFHLTHPEIRFQGRGWIRPVYFTILATHVPLAMTVPVLVAITLSRALRRRFDRHRRIARWTLPIWAYVSFTGVIVYWLLYRWGQ